MANKIARVVNLRRVAVTGIGMITCLGSGKDFVWDRLLRGECGLTRLNGEGMCCKISHHNILRSIIIRSKQT